MFKTGDTIIYGAHGLCRIDDTVKKDFAGKSRKYYLLKPIYQPNSTIFVPMDNPALISKMHHVLSSAEIERIIAAAAEKDGAWIADDEERARLYHRIISGGDRLMLIQSIKSIYIHRKKQAESGKKLHQADERFLHDAEKLIFNEFAHVLGLNPENVLPFILDRIGLSDSKTGAKSEKIPNLAR